MLDQLLAASGGAFLLGAIVLALRVDRDEARRAAESSPGPARSPAPQGRGGLRLVGRDG